MKTNYSLIGMAGAGKTFFGKILARKLNYKFLDLDKLIEKQEKKKLPKLIEKVGEKKFLELEEKLILNLPNLEKTIISTGGSVIYCNKSMKKLKNISKIIFINTKKEEIKKRIEKRIEKGNNSIIGLKKKGFEALYLERLELYKKYSDLEIKSLRELLNKIKIKAPTGAKK